MEVDSLGDVRRGQGPSEPREHLPESLDASSFYHTDLASSCGDLAETESEHWFSERRERFPPKHRRKDDKAKDIVIDDDSMSDFGTEESYEEESVHFSDNEVYGDEEDDRKPMFVPIAPIPITEVLKLSAELRHAYRICRELMSDQYRSINEPFYYPVNPFELGLSDYKDRVKKPMDLSTIHAKFSREEYNTITEVVGDLRLLLENCYRYNGITHHISKKAEKLEQILEQKLALLSRGLREKTSLIATNAVQQKSHLNAFIQSGSRRRSSRLGNEGESPIMMQIKLEEEFEEKSRKKQKEKERKDAVEAKINDLQEWDDKVLTPELLHDISTMWEIPSVGLFLCILKDFLQIPEFNYTEFELGVLFPNKSSFLAKIFTSLLVSKFQRQRLGKKSPMDYRNWSTKVKGKLQTWYKMAESRGKLYASSLWGFDVHLFHVLGGKFPLENESFHELSLKQRMWILKALCEACLEEDSEMKEHLCKLEVLDRQDLNLGQDADNFSYHYFQQFGTSDVRVYKQIINATPVVPVMENDMLVDENGNGESMAEGGKHTERIKGKRKEKKSKQEKTGKKTSNATREKLEEPDDAMSFELVAWDVQSLRELTASFAEQPKRRGVKYIPRKPCVVDLHQTLEAILEEVSKRESGFLKSMQKAKLRVMEDYEMPDPPETALDEGDNGQNKAQEWNSESEDDNDSEFDKKSVHTDVDSKVSTNGQDTLIKQEEVQTDNLATNSTTESHSAWNSSSTDLLGVKMDCESNNDLDLGDLGGRLLRRTRQRTLKSIAYKDNLDQNRKQKQKIPSKKQDGGPSNKKRRIGTVDNDVLLTNMKTKKQNLQVEMPSHYNASHPQKEAVQKKQAKRAKQIRAQLKNSSKDFGKPSKQIPPVGGSAFVFDGLRALADIASLTQRQEGLVKHPLSVSTNETTCHDGLSSAVLSAKASKLNLSAVMKDLPNKDAERKPLTVTVVSSRGQEERNVTLRKWSRPNILSSKSPTASGKSNVKIVAPSGQIKDMRGRQLKYKGYSKKGQGSVDLTAPHVTSQLLLNPSGAQHLGLGQNAAALSVAGTGGQITAGLMNTESGNSVRKTSVATTTWSTQGPTLDGKSPAPVKDKGLVHRISGFKTVPIPMGNHGSPKIGGSAPGSGIATKSPAASKSKDGFVVSGQGIQPRPVVPSQQQSQDAVNKVLSHLLNVAVSSNVHVSSPLSGIPRVVAHIPNLTGKELNARSPIYSGMQTVTASGTGSVATVHVHVLNPKIAPKQQHSDKNAETAAQKGPITILPKGQENVLDRAGSGNVRENLLEQVHQILRTRGITLPKPRRETRETAQMGMFNSSIGAKYDLEAALSVVRSSMSAPKSTPSTVESSTVRKVQTKQETASSPLVVVSSHLSTAPAVSNTTGALSVNPSPKASAVPVSTILTGISSPAMPKVALAPIKPATAKSSYKFPANFKAKPTTKQDVKTTTEIHAVHLSPNPTLNKIVNSPSVPQLILPSKTKPSDSGKANVGKQGTSVGGPVLQQLPTVTSKYMAIQVVSPNSSPGTLVTPFQQRLPAQAIQVIPSYATIGNLVKPITTTAGAAAATPIGSTSSSTVVITSAGGKLQPVVPISAFTEPGAPQMLLPAGVRPVALQPVHLVPGAVPQALIPVPVLATSAPLNEAQKVRLNAPSPPDLKGNRTLIVSAGSNKTPETRTSKTSSHCSTKKDEIEHEGVDPAECDMFGHWRTIMCKSKRCARTENVLIDVSSRSKAAKLISDIRKGSSTKPNLLESTAERTPPLFCNERLSPTHDLHLSNGQSRLGRVYSTTTASATLTHPPTVTTTGTCTTLSTSPSFSSSQPSVGNGTYCSVSIDDRTTLSGGRDMELSDDITAQPLPDPRQLTNSITSLNTSAHLTSLDTLVPPNDKMSTSNNAKSGDSTSNRTISISVPSLGFQPSISSKVLRLLTSGCTKRGHSNPAVAVASPAPSSRDSSCENTKAVSTCTSSKESPAVSSVASGSCDGSEKLETSDNHASSQELDSTLVDNNSVQSRSSTVEVSLESVNKHEGDSGGQPLPCEGTVGTKRTFSNSADPALSEEGPSSIKRAK